MPKKRYMGLADLERSHRCQSLWPTYDVSGLFPIEVIFLYNTEIIMLTGNQHSHSKFDFMSYLTNCEMGKYKFSEITKRKRRRRRLCKRVKRPKAVTLWPFWNQPFRFGLEIGDHLAFVCFICWFSFCPKITFRRGNTLLRQNLIINKIWIKLTFFYSRMKMRISVTWVT